MSTRRLLNLTAGAVSLLLVGAVVCALTGGDGPVDPAAVDLAKGQGAALAGLQRDARDLAAAADLADVNAARERLGTDILRFDRRLSALLNGGSVTLADGSSRHVKPVADAAARRTLTAAATTWRRIGVPLADLAAGSFSAYSAAGRSALAGLESGGPDLAAELADVAAAVQTAADSHTGRRTWARGAVVVLTILLAGLFLLRRFVRDGVVARPAPETAETGAVPAAAVPGQPAARPMAPRRPCPAPPPSVPLRPYTSPVDLEDVSQAVDRLAVDMDTIATNSDKMRVAIDSVGQALQGMLFSLEEMAKDTAEGERLVSGAHTAATYTKDVAEALDQSVREMGAVVSSVSELARRTRATADQIAKEAAHGERTGRGFTPAVGNEVRGLALRTGAATADIEDTVSGLLAGIREYEESIGEILQHVSAINRVSQDLGRVMLDPPGPAVVPAPSPPAAQDAPDEPLADPDEPFADADAPVEDLGEVTATAIADAADALATETGDPLPEPVVAEESGAAAGDGQEPAPETAAPVPPAAETFSLDPGDDPVPAAPAAEDHPKVFVLSKPSPPAADPAPEAQDAVVEDEPAETREDPFQAAPPPAPEPDPVAGSEAVAEPAPEPDPAGEPEPATASEPAADDEPADGAASGSNIFILNAPETPLAPAPAVQDEIDEDLTFAEPDPDGQTVPPDDRT
jgi:hypothetical protein